MAFAPFPPATYLCDGARTEGEMKTAFENWLLASKQMEHGQCRLCLRECRRSSSSSRSRAGASCSTTRRFWLPVGGLSLTNAGLVATASYLRRRSTTTRRRQRACVETHFISADRGHARVVDPDSGVEHDVASTAGRRSDRAVRPSSGSSRRRPPASSPRRRLASLYDPSARRDHRWPSGPADFATGSATPVPALAASPGAGLHRGRHAGGRRQRHPRCARTASYVTGPGLTASRAGSHWRP